MSAPIQQPRLAPRLHFYTVAMRNPEHTSAVLTRIRTLADTLHLSDDVAISSDDAALAERGIFFLRAPASFAESLRSSPDIASLRAPRQRQRGRLRPY